MAFRNIFIQTKRVKGFITLTYMSSLFLMILTATSWLALALSLARTTLLNTP